MYYDSMVSSIETAVESFNNAFERSIDLVKSSKVVDHPIVNSLVSEEDNLTSITIYKSTIDFSDDYYDQYNNILNSIRVMAKNILSKYFDGIILRYAELIYTYYYCNPNKFELKFVEGFLDKDYKMSTCVISTDNRMFLTKATISSEICRNTIYDVSTNVARLFAK